MSSDSDFMAMIMDWFGQPPYLGWGLVGLVVLLVLIIIILSARTRSGRRSSSSSISSVPAPSAVQPAQRQAMQASAPPPMAGGVTLVAVAGPLRGKRYDLQLASRIVFGRNPQVSDVSAQGDDMISGRHCEFRLESGKVLVRDLGSLNGTIINGVTISSSGEVASGDILLLGDTEFEATIV